MSTSSPSPFLSRSDTTYIFLACLFVGILMLTNIIGTKLFVFLPEVLPQSFFGTALILTTGIITYPITFWLTDIVSELWGKRHADLMVFFGFVMSILMLLVIYLAKALPEAEVWQISKEQAHFFHPDYYIRDPSDAKITGVNSQAAQAAFSFAFDAPSLLLFASMMAYLSAQLLDNFLFHFWRKRTKGRYLWLRNNGSTFISQLADTLIVNSIFLYFYWEMPWYETSVQKPVSIFQVTVGVYCCKVLIALLDTPFVYAGVFLLRRFNLTGR